jgi:RNA polymerase sigma-70 factor (ECF subfamily)
VAGLPTEPPTDQERTGWLLRYEAWLRLLARSEIDSRFAGKFSASDAVQQTMLEAWRCWDRFEGHSPEQRLAWLRQILAHQLAHLARQYAGTLKRDIGREQSLEASLTHSSARLEGLLRAPGPTPSQVVAAHEEQLRLAEVLERLPEDYRQVIMLRNLCDLSHDQIAERLGRTAGAVRMLWVRALARLRDELVV